MAGDIEGGKQEFYVLIERDEDGIFVGEVPQLCGCCSQGKTLDELMKNIQEVIELCLMRSPTAIIVRPAPVKWIVGS